MSPRFSAQGPSDEVTGALRASGGSGGSPPRASTATKALQAALAAENSAVYGYGVAGAHLTGARRATAVRYWVAHENARDTLTSMLTAMGGQPVATAAAYQLPFPIHSALAAVSLAALLEAQVHGRDPVFQECGERDGGRGVVHREGQLVRGRRGYGLPAPRGEHAGEGVPGVLVRDPVPCRCRPLGPGEVRASHPVPVDGRVLRGQRRLQSLSSRGLAHWCLPGVLSNWAWVASEAEMLASSWARGGVASCRCASKAVAAAFSASRR